MTIPQAAVDAAADAVHEAAFGQGLPEHPVNFATAALEAAMPHIRKQIAEELLRDIREAVAKNEATPKTSQYRDRITDGLMRAHRLVEKGTEQ